MKDNFSVGSDNYARYRPVYPNALFDYLLTITAQKDNVWDCGTGNGQVANKLARHFKQVWATDISQSQIDHATPNPKVNYSVQPAEETNFPDAIFDLIVVAQAVHWFNFKAFNQEVQRTLKSNGHLVLVGYELLNISAEVDRIIQYFYTDIIGEYWDAERKYIEEGYKTIPFPFIELTPPDFSISVDWTFEHLIGYLNTWSAVRHFEKQNGFNPLKGIKNDLQNAWGDEALRKVAFPLIVRVGAAKRYS
jgi:SAM-dependent methyltransferase